MEVSLGLRLFQKIQTMKLKQIAVLATGGFGGNEDYVKELIPDIMQTGYQFTGTGANTGDGMRWLKKWERLCMKMDGSSQFQVNCSLPKH